MKKFYDHLSGQLKLNFCLFAFILFASFGNIYAVTDNSAATGNWSAGGTWSTGSKPTSATDAAVLAAHSITVDQNLSITAATWTFNGPVVDAAGGSAYTLTVANSSSLVIKSTFTLEGAVTIKDNANLNINGASGTTMTVGALTLKDDATINIAAGCTLIVNGTLTLKDNMALTLNGVLQVNGTVTAKDDAAITGTTGVFSATGAVTTSNSSSIFGSGNDCASGPCSATPTSALPVTLVKFTAEKNGETLKLLWTTATEVNNDYFTLEKSVNGITYDKVGTVKGSGNSSTQKDYSFIDESPTEGNSYYRLKQTDLDGTNETFNAIAVYYELKPNGECVLKVFPNPCIGQCNVSLEGCDNTQNPDIAVEVMDVSGNKVYSKIPNTDDKGLFNFQIDTQNNLTPGIYIVRGTNKKSSYAQKLIVK